MVSGTYDKNTAYDRGKSLSLVDAVEILDARVPQSSRNPEMDSMVGSKPRLLLLNKADMADPSATSRWIAAYRKQGFCGSRYGLPQRKGRFQFCTGSAGTASAGTAGKAGGSRHDRCTHSLNGGGNPECGQVLLYQPHGTVQAGEGGRPSRRDPYQTVGENAQHGTADMPGVLWPKFDVTKTVAQKLAFTGAINDDVMDLEALACLSGRTVSGVHPKALEERYRMTDLQAIQEDGFAMLELLGRKRGMLISGGEVNTERAAITLLDEFRSGKLGRITLELPEQEAL